MKVLRTASLGSNFTCSYKKNRSFLNFRSLSGIIFAGMLRCKSSRWEMFFEIAVLKYFAIFTGKHLRRSLFLIKLLTEKLVLDKTV